MLNTVLEGLSCRTRNNSTLLFCHFEMSILIFFSPKDNPPNSRYRVLLKVILALIHTVYRELQNPHETPAVNTRAGQNPV